ncbi:MAG TPA: PilZ domain-containing protein [Vicinamibacterales bacterium]|nr:PilZ domain-containing protein [Vicinamibacterales bacterium]
MGVAQRVAGSEIEAGSEVKLFPGGPAELVNLSQTGALVETKSRLVAGAVVTLCIGGTQPQRLPGKAVRCQVCAIHRDSTMTYQVAITFDEPAPVDVAPMESAEVAMDAAPEPPPDTAAAAIPDLVNEW